MPRSAAVSGKAASGASTLAQMLVEELRALGGDALAVSFADELVAEVAEVSGLERGQRGFVVALRERNALRLEEDPDYWVKRTAERLGRLAQSGVVGVAEGFARRREAELLRGQEVFLIRVEAGPKLRGERLEALGRDPQLARSKDPSEIELDGYEFDFVVKNSTSLERLRRQARDVAKILLD